MSRRVGVVAVGVVSDETRRRHAGLNRLGGVSKTVSVVIKIKGEYLPVVSGSITVVVNTVTNFRGVGMDGDVRIITVLRGNKAVSVRVELRLCTVRNHVIVNVGKTRGHNTFQETYTNLKIGAACKADPRRFGAIEEPPEPVNEVAQVNTAVIIGVEAVQSGIHGTRSECATSTHLSDNRKLLPKSASQQSGINKQSDKSVESSW
jgi:hypothetical protein